MQSTCRICHSEGDNPSFEVHEMQFGTRECFVYFECSNCACLQIAEIPKDLSSFYPRQYQSLLVQPANYFNNSFKRLLKKFRTLYTVTRRGLIGRALYRRNADLGLEALSLIKLSVNTRILDVGCGNGARLYDLKNAGFVNLLGVDPFIGNDILYANHLRIEKKTLQEVGGEWDVIMFHHSFEHLCYPLETLRHASNLLSAGGQCLLRIPTTSSWAWRHYRENWAQIDAPRHIFIHSRDSLKILADLTGMEIRGFFYDSDEFQFFASELYARGISLNEGLKKGDASSLLGKSQLRAFKKRAAKLNKQQQGDQFVCLLGKTSDIST